MTSARVALRPNGPSHLTTSGSCAEAAEHKTTSTPPASAARILAATVIVCPTRSAGCWPPARDAEAPGGDRPRLAAAIAPSVVARHVTVLDRMDGVVDVTA